MAPSSIALSEKEYLFPAIFPPPTLPKAASRTHFQVVLEKLLSLGISFASLPSSLTGGRMAAWAVAIGVVAAWNCYDNQKNTSESFSKAEQESWNAQKKKQQQDASTSAGSSSK
ncbi:hypothetical protein ACHAXH_008181 [Discostella pseudostelligera]